MRKITRLLFYSVLCPMDWGSSFFILCFLPDRYSLSGKRGLQDFSNIPFHSGWLHSCVHGLSYLSTEGVVHIAWSFASPCFSFLFFFKLVQSGNTDSEVIQLWVQTMPRTLNSSRISGKSLNLFSIRN